MLRRLERLIPYGLARRLALWVALSTSVALVVFAIVAVAVVVEEQAESEPDAPDVILREARAQIGEAMLVAAPVGLLLAFVGALIVTQRTLRPLAQVIQSATRITARELGERLPLPRSDDEVRAVVIAMNGLLARLELGFGALDRFAADASHELRTPLTVVATELEVMLQSPRDLPDWERCARLCQGEVRHLAQLVSALLDLARAERLDASLGIGVELRVLVTRVLQLAAARARERGVQLVAALGHEAECVVRGDEDALISALANVVDNAVRYSQAGGVVRISSDAQDHGAVLVHVDDTGPGVGALEREHIFEPFARGAAGRTAAMGFGLGLTIARRICDHYQIELSLGQSPLGGARFSFVFRASP